jgi:arabinogalactan endo-1,4-beta-galactosidase
MKQMLYIYFAFIVCLSPTAAQSFYFGNDLSYVNQMEDCGAVFKENNQPKDVYRIFADHGTNLVRVRLWIDPSWWQDPLVQPPGVKPHYNDLPDVEETIQRAKLNGMQVLLDLHYSDFWADPARQLIPRVWLGVAYNPEKLADSVYNYTKRVLTHLEARGLMPELVQVGNENNGGLLNQIPTTNGFEVQTTVSTSWARHGKLYNAAIKAIREVGSSADINPKIAVHFTNALSGHVWNFNNILQTGGVTDFDIMGISYYYAWHNGSIPELKSTIQTLVNTFPAYDIMVLETGYHWTTENVDAMPNIVTKPDQAYLPVSPENQLEYLVDYTRAVMEAGGRGVIFWEPAWVSTPCRTPWGKGSSHDHLVFFDPVNNNFMENGGGRFTEPHWYQGTYTEENVQQAEPDLVRIYPSPAIQTVTLCAGFTGSYMVDVMDVGGKVLLQTPAWINSGHCTTLNVSNLHTGQYFIRVRGEQKQAVRKVFLN